ncbi:MAG: dUTP diphosphatase [Verrucomicrobiota bacterium]
MKKTLKIQKIHQEAVTPHYAHPGDAGLDLFAFEDAFIPSGEYRRVGTGVRIELPEGTEGQVRPRSGLALKHGVTVLNSPGTVDEGYRGEVAVILINHGKEDFVVSRGMKIAQMLIKNVETVNLSEVASLSETSRGDGGFGSTG